MVIKNPSEKYIQRINEVKYLLKKNDNPRVKNLTFGYGYQPFAKEMTVDELYNYADQKMYADKNRKKDLSNQVL